MRPLPFFGLLALLAAVPAMAAEPLDVNARPIEEFGLTGSETEAGPLTFLGGLHLTSTNRRFGGLSGIDFAADGSVFIVSDSGRFVRARLRHENGRLAGVTDAEIGNLLPESDDSKQDSDVEDVAFDPADPGRGVIVQERQAEALRSFRLDDGAVTAIEPIPVSAEPRLLRSNRGLESVAIAPAASPLAGSVVVIAEATYRRRSTETIPGWIVGAGSFEIVQTDDFDISSARFLPDGDLLLLERRYAPAWGIAMRLRRVPGGEIEVGARLGGEVLMEAGMTYQIDNMEGLAVHQDEAGRTILTIVSDNNYSILQRTLILQFALDP